MREADVQHAVLLAWGSHPRLRLARINTGKAYPPGSDRLVTFGVPGTADVMGILAPTGRLVCIELKSAKGRQREDQKRFERIVTQYGGAYCLARSLADVDAFMASLGVTR